MQTPASVYASSPRAYPGTLSDPEYPSHFDVRRAKSNGVISLREQSISLGIVLQRECVGLEPIADGVWHLFFGPVFLGRLTELGRAKFHLEKNKPVSRAPAQPP